MQNQDYDGSSLQKQHQEWANEYQGKCAKSTWGQPPRPRFRKVYGKPAAKKQGK